MGLIRILSMFEKEIIIDGRNHLLGRLASIVAKELLNGQRVVVVRCEQILRSGSLFRNKLKRQEQMHHRCNATHWKSPSRILWKVIRGMTPHKTSRGAAAMSRLKVFEGIPFPYDQKKRMVIPQALKVLRMKSHRNFCSMGDLASITGWTKQDIVSKLEDKRKEKSAAFHEQKEKKVKARAAALEDKSVAKFNEELKKYGF